MDVEFRHLRAFHVLATELNFTRAAARLHLTQQALSNQIKQLETRIGATLFQRNSRQVTLTDAGRTLLARVPDILDTVGAAIADTRDTESGQRTELIVGIRGVTGLDLTPRVLRAFATEYPHVAVTVGKVGFDDASAGVLVGASDVGLIWLPAPDGLDVTPLLAEERIALLPADHPFAAATAVPPAEMAVQPFAWWTDNRDLAARDFMTLADYRDGPATIGAEVATLEDLLAAVGSGQAVAVSVASVSRFFPWSGVITRPLLDVAPSVLAVACRAGEDRPLVAAFIRIATKVAAELIAEGAATDVLPTTGS
ncbi:LysR family transcriptional regulator [Nocardia colli]|uniref:LysR family transcriptional regulator n=1 Tax=Nocardia colli TaxID=2545717 RepID=A0A5N0E9W2_9NOCA|nr:LysR family transcriptional regulator [Nocardia colli]KAA8884964.1 LysR family transcriptional regulator [Nocardia colli]